MTSQAEDTLSLIARTVDHKLPRGAFVNRVLRELVSSMEADERLPSERVLADRLGISRTTIRQEVERLVTDGVLYRRPKSGTFAAPRDYVHVDLVTSFSQFARRRGAEPSARVLVAARQQPTERVAQLLGIAEGADVFVLSRIRSMDGTPMAIEHTTLDPCRFVGLEDVDWTRESLFDVLAQRWSVEVGGSEVQVRAVLPRSDEASALRIPTSMPCLLAEGVTRDASGDPIEISKSLLRGDKYDFVVATTRRSPAPDLV
ncbi:GntR family transcriptional regulator [Spirillospora sp. CA-255316]